MRSTIAAVREQRDAARSRLRALERELRKALHDPETTVDDVRVVFSAHCRGELERPA